MEAPEQRIRNNDPSQDELLQGVMGDRMLEAAAPYDEDQLTSSAGEKSRYIVDDCVGPTVPVRRARREVVREMH